MLQHLQFSSLEAAAARVELSVVVNFKDEKGGGFREGLSESSEASRLTLQQLLTSCFLYFVEKFLFYSQPHNSLMVVVNLSRNGSR